VRIVVEVAYFCDCVVGGPGVATPRRPGRQQDGICGRCCSVHRFTAFIPLRHHWTHPRRPQRSTQPRHTVSVHHLYSSSDEKLFIENLNWPVEPYPRDTLAITYTHTWPYQCQFYYIARILVNNRQKTSADGICISLHVMSILVFHHHHHLFAQIIWTRRRTHDQHENKSRTRKAQKLALTFCQ